MSAPSPWLHRGLVFAFVLVALIAIGLFLRGYFHDLPPTGTPLAEKMRGLLAQPASGMGVLEPGTLLRVETMALVARPSEAYEHPDRLKQNTAWQPVMRSGRFEDRLEAEGTLDTGLLSFLGRGESAEQLKAQRVAGVVTTIQDLQRIDVSEVQLLNASLKNDLAASVASGKGVIVVQTVFMARSMTIAYRDARGQSAAVTLPESTLSGALKTGSRASTTSEEEYADVILGYKAALLAGGPDSSLTAQTARELAEDLKNNKGYEAKAMGNLLLIETTKDSAPQISEAVRVAVERDRVIKAGDAARAELLRRHQQEAVLAVPRKERLALPRDRLRTVPAGPG